MKTSITELKGRAIGERFSTLKFYFVSSTLSLLPHLFRHKHAESEAQKRKL